jgi:hypothetical protein
MSDLDGMQDADRAATERRTRRRDEALRFVAGAGLSLDALAPSTQKCLDDWARQHALVRDQPSANYGTVVLHLCRAVESELAHAFGQRPELEFLRDEAALGDKIRRLDHLSDFARKTLASQGVRIGSLRDLVPALSALNGLRRQKRIAHGGDELIEATASDARQAERLTQRTLKCIHAANQRR